MPLQGYRIPHADLRGPVPRVRTRVRTARTHRRLAACPSCHGQDLERLLSHSLRQHRGHASESIQQSSRQAKLVQRDKDVAQAEDEKKHHEEGHWTANGRRI